jgi:molecular chaperone HscB
MRLWREFYGLNVNATAGATARDYFSLFQLEPGFSIDEAALERAYHSLLSQFHPDCYAGKAQFEQRVAAQFCADINSGYRVLSDEVLRAEYLLTRAGVNLAKAEREGVGAAFLMTQIMLRERLEEMSPSDGQAREVLTEEIRGYYQASCGEFAAAAGKVAWSEAARHWQEMCFLSKLLDDARPRSY